MTGLQVKKEHPPVESFNWMHPIRWVPPDAADLLDVGCNVGDFLMLCRDFFPSMRLAGVGNQHRGLECRAAECSRRGFACLEVPRSYLLLTRALTA